MKETGERERGQKQTARGGRELCALPHSPTPLLFLSVEVAEGGEGGGRVWCGRPVRYSTLLHSAREENVTEQNMGKIGEVNRNHLANLALLAKGDDSDKVVLGASWNWDGLVGLWGAWQGIIFHRRRRRQRQKNRAGESSSSSSFPTKEGKGVFGTGTHKEKTASI